MIISIHALREEGDVVFPPALQGLDAISIHALREEGDAYFYNISCIVQLFLSTPSARRATQQSYQIKWSRSDFYPRPPRGGRPRQPQAAFAGHKQFLSTPSARRATLLMRSVYLFLSISIHALREEGDSEAPC